jgi:hypothetical protein
MHGLQMGGRCGTLHRLQLGRSPLTSCSTVRAGRWPAGSSVFLTRALTAGLLLATGTCVRICAAASDPVALLQPVPPSRTGAAAEADAGSRTSRQEVAGVQSRL